MSSASMWSVVLTPCRQCLRVVLVLAPMVCVSAGLLPDSPNKYDQTESFDLRKIPFSRYGSYLAFRHVGGEKQPEGDGLSVFTVHGNLPQRQLFRITLRDGRNTVPFEEIATPTLLKLKATAGEVEIFFAEPQRVRFRSHGVAVRFERSRAAQESDGSFAEPVDGPGVGARAWDFTASSQDITLRFRALAGDLDVENAWNGQRSDKVAFTFSPDRETSAQGTIEEFSGSYHSENTTPATLPLYLEAAKAALASHGPTMPAPREADRSAPLSFDEELARVRKEYAQWLSTMPSVPESMQGTADLAAYVNWSAIVAPQGFFTRPAMLMSKVSMNAVWSWDQCFNAMALASSQPELAWDQLMLVFDSANADGISPDLETDRHFIWSFSKPPIHGLVMAYLEQQNPLFFGDQKRLREIYPKLARRTEWYLRFRDWDKDGLSQYNHGNDSGWDNSTVFLTLPPVETPDLAAFLVLQMEELSNIAARIQRTDESRMWSQRARAMLNMLIDRMWRGGHFVALHNGDHKVVESDSLLLYIPLVLGKQLPASVRNEMIQRLKEPGHFLTRYGLATEPLKSPWYIEDGYWRGPIWAPSTLLVAEGIDAAGEHEFANELRRRFCDAVMKSGFAENFAAPTGAGLRDPAYTWTSSVFLLFAHELVTNTRAEFVSTPDSAVPQQKSR